MHALTPLACLQGRQVRAAQRRQRQLAAGRPGRRALVGHLGQLRSGGDILAHKALCLGTRGRGEGEQRQFVLLHPGRARLEGGQGTRGRRSR